MSRFHYYAKRPWKIFGALERFIAYRTYDKYHVVDTGLEPSYYDKDTILLHANFAILVDFVESELAGMQLIFANRKKLPLKEKIRLKLPLLLERILLPDYRSSKRGLLYIQDRIRLHKRKFNKKTDHGFADALAFDKYNKHHLEFWEEVKSLYIWWTKTRPNRRDEDDVSGLTEFRRKMKKKYKSNCIFGLHKFEPVEGKVTAVFQTRWDKFKTKFLGKPPRKEGFSRMVFVGNKLEEKQYRGFLKVGWKIEEYREAEDTKNLIRLIKIRRGLWT